MLSALYQFLTSLGYPSPIHPPLTHMPMGLVTGALIFGLIARFYHFEKLAFAARACIILALIFALITMLFGFMDWRHYYSGGWLHPVKMKLILAGVLLGLLILAAILAQGMKPPDSALLVVYALCFFTVTGLGWFGDKLTFSARIDALPKQFQPGVILFINDCYSCHPDGGNLIAPDLQLRWSEKLKNLFVFIRWVRDPKPPMPSFGPSRLSEPRAKVLYKYLFDFIWKPEDPNADKTSRTAMPPGGGRGEGSGK